ncbi:MAG TPA: phage holin family protein [Rhodothermales bacterium]|nr:phage holin family protein [Rhodothermales bacterium]
MPFPDDRDNPVVSPRLGAGRLPARRDTPPLLDPDAETAPVTHRLPAHKGKLERMTDHIAGIGEDVKDLVELRIQLVKREVMEQNEGRLTSVKGQAVFGALAAMSGVFLLITLAFAFAALYIWAGVFPPLGYCLGFLTITLLFAFCALLAKRKFAPGRIRVEHDKETGKVRMSMAHSPADHERMKAAEEGRPVDETKTGKAVSR